MAAAGQQQHASLLTADCCAWRHNTAKGSLGWPSWSHHAALLPGHYRGCLGGATLGARGGGDTGGVAALVASLGIDVVRLALWAQPWLGRVLMWQAVCMCVCERVTKRRWKLVCWFFTSVNSMQAGWYERAQSPSQEKVLWPLRSTVWAQCVSEMVDSSTRAHEHKTEP